MSTEQMDDFLGGGVSGVIHTHENVELAISNWILLTATLRGQDGDGNQMQTASGESGPTCMRRSSTLNLDPTCPTSEMLTTRATSPVWRHLKPSKAGLRDQTDAGHR